MFEINVRRGKTLPINRCDGFLNDLPEPSGSVVRAVLTRLELGEGLQENHFAFEAEKQVMAMNFRFRDFGERRGKAAHLTLRFTKDKPDFEDHRNLIKDPQAMLHGKYTVQLPGKGEPHWAAGQAGIEAIQDLLSKGYELIGINPANTFDVP